MISRRAILTSILASLCLGASCHPGAATANGAEGPAPADSGHKAAHLGGGGGGGGRKPSLIDGLVGSAFRADRDRAASETGSSAHAARPRHPFGSWGGSGWGGSNWGGMPSAAMPSHERRHKGWGSSP